MKKSYWWIAWGWAWALIGCGEEKGTPVAPSNALPAPGAKLIVSEKAAGGTRFRAASLGTLNIVEKPGNLTLSAHPAAGRDEHIFHYADIVSRPTSGKPFSLPGTLLIEDTDLTSLAGLQGLRRITGSLRIYGNQSLHSLQGLEQLEQIGGSLQLSDNPGLSSLIGLEKLSEVGASVFIGGDGGGNANLISLAGLEKLSRVGDRLVVTGNASLAGLAALQGLNQVGGALIIGRNPALDFSSVGLLAAQQEKARFEEIIIVEHLIIREPQDVEFLSLLGGGRLRLEGFLSVEGTQLRSLQGLDFLNHIGGSVVVRKNARLTSLAGLEQLVSIDGGLFIEHNPQLEGLSSLGQLTDIGAALLVRDNPNLTSLAGLEKLEAIGGRLIIAHNHRLASLTGLQQLAQVEGALELNYNPALTSLAGLEKLEAIGGRLYIGRGHENLASVAGLQRLVQVEGGLELGYNPALDPASVGALGTRQVNGRFSEVDLSWVRIETRADIDSLGLLTGDSPFRVRSLEIIGPDIRSLQGLENLVEITGYFEIVGTELLADLRGLDNLVGSCTEGCPRYFSIQIRNNKGLESLDGLNRLTQIGTLYINRNPVLSNIDGLESLREGSITLEDNPALAGLDGLVNFKGRVNVWDIPPTFTRPVPVPVILSWDLIVDDEIDLSPLGYLLEGFTVRGNLLVQGTSRTDLAGLENLTGVGNFFTLADNPALEDIEALKNLTQVGNSFFIGGSAGGNPRLPSLDGLENLYQIGGRLVVADNALLTNVDGLEALETVRDGLVLGGNPLLSAVSLQALAANQQTGRFNRVCLTGSIEIEGPADIGLLQTLATELSIGGSLSIQSTAFTALPGPIPLVEIGGSLYVTNNPLLGDLDGLGQLTRIGESLFIGGSAGGNSLLENVGGLSGLTQIGGNLVVVDNPILSDLRGLDRLEQVDGLVLVGNNHSLSSAGGQELIRRLGP